jgi:hypothetical protein
VNVEPAIREKYGDRMLMIILVHLSYHTMEIEARMYSAPARRGCHHHVMVEP